MGRRVNRQKNRRSLKRREKSSSRTRSLAHIFERLEDRLALSVQFAAGPYLVPAINRTDIAPGDTQDGPIEPFVSINPLDPGNLAVTSQNGEQVTGNVPTNFNGPETFTTTLVYPLAPGYTSSSGDTGTAYDAVGRLFWANLQNPTGGGARDIVVGQVNPVTGAFIGNPVAVPHPAGFGNGDKEFLAADSNPNSPFANNLYVSMEYFNSTDNQFEVFVSRSTNQGQTWSTPVQLSVNSGANSEGWTWPSTVTVAKNGDVYVAYHAQPGTTDGDVEGADGGDDEDDGGGGALGIGAASGNNPTGTNGEVIVFRSTDGGATFPTSQRSVAFAPGLADITFNRQDALNDHTIPGTTFWTVGSVQPWVLADPTRPGFVYVVTADDPNNGSTANVDHADVVFARSGNNGTSWINSTIESGPNNSFQLFPNASIDKFGNIFVSWYTNASLTANGSGQFLTPTNSSGDFLLNVWAKYSTDGGVTWSNSFQVNDLPIDPDVAVNNRFTGPPATTRIGEYFGADIFGGTAYLAWRDSSRDASNNPVGPSRVLFDAVPINGSLTVTGDDTGGPTNDNFTLRQIVNNPGFVEVLDTVGGVTTREYAGLLTGIAGGIKFNGLSGNDTLTVDFTNGNPIPAGGLDFNGGDGFDSMTLQGGAETADTYSPGLDNSSGLIQITAGATAATATAGTIHFEGLSPVFDLVPGPAVYNGTPANNFINYTEGMNPGGAVDPAWGQITVDNFEPVNFTAKTTVAVNGLAGNDSFNLDNPFTPAGLVSFTVNGDTNGTPTETHANNTLYVNGSGGGLITFTPSGPDSGSIGGALRNGGGASFNQIENVVVDGHDTGNYRLNVVTPAAGNNRITLDSGVNPMFGNSGTAADSGTVNIQGPNAGVQNSPTLSFLNLGLLGGAGTVPQVTFVNAVAATKTDTLTYNGTAGADYYSIDARNGGEIFSHSPPVPNSPPSPFDQSEFVVTGPSVRDLYLNGGEGNDNLIVDDTGGLVSISAATNAFNTVTWDGGAGSMRCNWWIPGRGRRRWYSLTRTASARITAKARTSSSVPPARKRSISLISLLSRTPSLRSHRSSTAHQPPMPSITRPVRTR